MDSARSVYFKFSKAIPKTYAELRDFFEKERPAWRKVMQRPDFLPISFE